MNTVNTNQAVLRPQPGTNITKPQEHEVPPPAASLLSRCTAAATKADPELMLNIISTNTGWIESDRWRCLKIAVVAIFTGTFYNRQGTGYEMDRQTSVSSLRLALLYIGMHHLCATFNPFNKLDEEKGEQVSRFRGSDSGSSQTASPQYFNDDTRYADFGRGSKSTIDGSQNSDNRDRMFCDETAFEEENEEEDADWDHVWNKIDRMTKD